MFAFLKKILKNAKGEEEAVESKFNAISSLMDVDGEKVPVSELIATHEASLAEIAKQEELKNQEAEEEVLMENTVKTAEGKEYKIGDLIASHRNKMTAKKNAAEEEEKAKKEKEAKENSEKEAKEKAEKEAKENSETPEEKELKIKKQNEKEASDKAAAEAAEAERKKKENSKPADKMRFFKHLNSLREEAQVKKENAVKSIGTMSDRIAKGKARFGSKNSSKK